MVGNPEVIRTAPLVANGLNWRKIAFTPTILPLGDSWCKCLFSPVIIYVMRFPDWREAPDELFKIDGHCGLVAAWTVLHYFGKRVSVPKLVEACRYTKRHGVFTVSLAAALKTYGLSVSFHSQPDAHIEGFERRCYAYARRVGIVAEVSLELSEVLRWRKRGNIPIVLFNTPANDGHF
jgi:hypothetical protein